MAVKCPKCQTENPETVKFCGECGTQLIPLSSDVRPEVTETLQTAIQELTTGSIFAGRYQIIEELGKGGMGRVYKVFDQEVQAKMALKLIKPEVSADKNTIDRFRNELKIARDISHKNICRMYDLGREGGNYFITMEYVSGEDLKSFIRRAKQLVVGTAIFIAKQVCEGLAEAHRVGVVHRDLKPGNIMIDKEGNAKIMDFGIARSISIKGITGAGVMIGTPEYMSPEQVEGKEVDQRSDIYSLGIILYEMLTGQVPFEGDTPFTVGVKQKSEIPKDPREINAQIPDDLSRMILKCLEKDKEKRYQSAGEVRSELQNIEKGIPTTEKVVLKRKPITSRKTTVTFGLKKLFIPGSVVIALVIIALVIWKPWSKKEAVTQPPGSPSIAVLPFEDLSPERNQGYFCDGLADELINRLSRISSLKIPARTSSFLVKSQGLDIKEIGEKLDVENVLEGSIRKAGNMFRVTVQLVNVKKGSPIWSEKFEGVLADVFSLQDKISLAIVDNLKIKLLSEEKSKIAVRNTENTEAYNLYLQGRFFWNQRTEEGLMKAIENFEKAIHIDPAFALAWAGISDCYNLLPVYVSSPPSYAFPKAKEAALKALEIDETLAEAHTSLAWVNMSFDWNWGGAEKEFKRSIELFPKYATAHHWYSIFLGDVGRTNEGIEENKVALDLNPFALVINKDLGLLYYYARKYDQAISILERTLEMNPNFPYVHLYLGWVYFASSLYEEALEEFKKEKELLKGFNSRDSRVECWIGISYANLKKIDKAQEVISGLKEQFSHQFVSPFLLAKLRFDLGEKDLYLKYLDTAYRERDINIRTIKADPAYDNMRSDPAFKQLIEKVFSEK
jgi:serine/threonine protein kinase/Tfp pilus assembly protein PilF